MDISELNQFLADLDSQEMDALQLAVLLGDSFSMDDVSEMIDINPSKLFDLIDKLLVGGLIRNKSKNMNGIFLFTHNQLPALLRNSMADEKKRLYLSNIIHHFELKLPNNAKKAMILVDLILKSKDDLNNKQYLKKAADLLVVDHQMKRALSIYREIIDDQLQKDQESMESILFIETVIAYAPIAINIYPPGDIFPIINRALSLSIKLGNKRAEAVLELSLGRLYQRQGKSLEASSHCNEGWRLSQEMDDEALRRFSSKFYALFLFWQGRITQAIQIYEDTLGNVESISPDLRDYWSYLVLAMCYAISGRVGRGLGLAEAVLGGAVSKGTKNIIAFSHAIIATILLDVGRFQKAEVHIDKAIEIGECLDIDLVLYISKQSKGYMEYKKGNLKKARELFETGFEHLEDTSVIHYPCPWFIEVLFSLHKTNMDPIKGHSFNSEINRLLEWPDIYMKGAALRYYAISKSINKDNVDEIEKLLKDSCDLLQEAGASVELGRTYSELSRHYIEVRDLAKAKDFAEKAHHILCEVDELLFPSQLSFLISNQSPEYNKNRGIRELNDAINHLPDFDKYLGQVVTVLTDMFGAEHTAILLARRETPKTFDVVATRNITPEELEVFQDENLQSLFLEMVQKGPVLVTAQRHKTMHHFAEYNMNIRSLALTPIMMSNNIIGLIYMDNRLLNGIFSKEDRILMKSISGQISMSIKHCGLYKEFTNLHLNITKEYYSEDEELEEQTDSTFPVIIGKSLAIRTLLSNVRKLASTDTTILIYGETGVGKELIAKAIHKLSKRSEKPLVVFNIAALSKNLISAELFGYEKGAFTDAVASKPGRFELANGGTIFLDEIGELTMDVQVKLLRVLQEGTFERVGSNKPIYSDFRVIAATNKNLHEMVQKGDFRTDLFYRINIFPIQVPALRERKEDIPSLALHFMKKYSIKYNKNIKGIESFEVEKLLAYSWPGNVRELEHIIERAVIISSGNNLIIPDLQSAFPEIPVGRSKNAELQPLEEVQRLHLLRVLNHTKWKIRGKNGAAEILGLKPTTLEFRMKKLGISNNSLGGRRAGA
ncbi:MAG: sigma 54-interacting transcriptional regulator [Syntrophobacteraceae bacterium]